MSLAAEVVGYMWLALVALALAVLAVMIALDALSHAVRRLKRAGSRVRVLPIGAGAPPAHPRKRVAR